MNPDFFRSHTISLVLSWVFSVPIVIGLIATPVIILLRKEEGIPRLLLIWTGLCVIVLSPIRYIVLQLLIATAYPLQSLHALLTLFLLALYVPIVFLILYWVAVALPGLGLAAIAGFKTTVSKTRWLLVGVTSPLMFFCGSYLFYLLLPYAGYSTHWLDAKDIIRATNGPPQYVYKYAVEQVTPLVFPGFAHKMGVQNLTAKERFRAHVAAIYLGNKQFSYYVYKAYPGYNEGQETDSSSGNIVKDLEKWPKLTEGEQADVNALMAKMVSEPITEEDLENVRRINQSYAKRTGRKMTERDIRLTTETLATILQYNLEIGWCLLRSIDTKKPFISDELKRLRTRMENIGYTRKTKLDEDFRRIVAAANNEVWTDEFGKECYPIKREEVLTGINRANIVSNNMAKYIGALKN